MKRRWGLQATMTATYVAVTAGAVLLTELVILGAGALSPSTALTVPELQARAKASAAETAAKLGVSMCPSGQLPGSALGLPGAPVTPGQAQPDADGGVAVPQTTTPLCDLAPASLAVVVSTDHAVRASSYPACFPVGGQPSAADAGAPRKVLTWFGWPEGGAGYASLPDGNVVWAAAPIMVGSPGAGPKGQAAGQTGTGKNSAGKLYGMLYVQVPAAGQAAGGIGVSPGLIGTGLVVLAAAVPAGLAFGLLSTRRLTRRLKRLAALTLEVADGGFERRVCVCGHDEVSQLEENFNRMASQLQASLDARRQLAEANARHAERSRIARELHDSISQELFSLSVLAGGLRRALPAESPVLTEVKTMERTAGNTMREMQSLLLALRPVALDEVGLASAIESVCRSYSERLGVDVRADLEPVELPPAVEHTVLRVTQEAVANAVRHACADAVTVRLSADSDRVLVEVTDNGQGFDVAARQAVGAGLGLGAMRERVAEHGGRFTIDSTPGVGTRVRACFRLDDR